MLRIFFCVLAIASFWYGVSSNKQNASTIANLPTTWQANQQRTDFINTWKATAVRLSQKDGIPASIRMAQAILESSDGSSDLAQQGNHFGIKCFKDHAHERSRSCTSGEGGWYKTYSTPKKSWQDHAKVLQAKRYTSLHGKEYSAWAIGLQRLGYASDRHYPRKLISLIEKHQLYYLDHQPKKPSTLFFSLGIVFGLLALFLPSTLLTLPASGHRRNRPQPRRRRQ